MKQKEKGLGTSVLGPGWGYFVDPDALASELKRVEINPEGKEVRTAHNYLFKLIFTVRRKTPVTLPSPPSNERIAVSTRALPLQVLSE
jgi:hypothetical protein